MGNKHSTDAFDPSDTRSLNQQHSAAECNKPFTDTNSGSGSATTSLSGVNPTIAPPPSTATVPTNVKVPSYFGLLSCSTIDVVPQTHQPLLTAAAVHNRDHLPVSSGPLSIPTAGGGFDAPMATTTDVWIVAGQSNAVGENGPDNQEVPDLGRPVSDLISVYLPDGRWTSLLEPCTHLGVHGYTDSRSVGPDVAFANTLLDLGCSTAVGLVPTASGGSNLHTQWAPGGLLYSYMVTQAKTAVATLPGARLRGVIWVQGEADAEAGHEHDAQTYGERLSAFITRLRQDLSHQHPCLPVVLGVMSTRQRSYFQYIHLVRQAQLDLDMPNVIKVDLAGYEFFEEYDAQLVHITKAGQCALGAAMAHAYYAFIHSPRIMSPRGAPPC